MSFLCPFCVLFVSFFFLTLCPFSFKLLVFLSFITTTTSTTTHGNKGQEREEKEQDGGGRAIKQQQQQPNSETAHCAVDLVNCCADSLALSVGQTERTESSRNNPPDQLQSIPEERTIRPRNNSREQHNNRQRSVRRRNASVRHRVGSTPPIATP